MIKSKDLKKTNVLFVGAFNINNKDGSTGGQLFACHTLINSELKESINFIKIDSTVTSVPVPPVRVRAINALFRVFKFLYILITKRVDTVLIFSADSFSFLEKGLMAIIANVFHKKVIFAPRSGISIDDYKNSKFMRWYMPIVIKASTYILCQGSFWKNFYFKMDPENEEKFVIVHNWINALEYKAVEFNLQTGVFKILYIGWLEEFKGILDLVKSLKKLSDKGLEFICNVYGNGALYEDLEKFILENKLSDKIFLKGWANKEIKREAYKNSDLFILPSHFEGFPNSLLEAMSAEMPIISSRVGAVDDIVRDTQNGLLFDHKNINQLISKIEFMINNPIARKEMAIEARKTINENFTISQAVKKFKEIL